MDANSSTGSIERNGSDSGGERGDRGCDAARGLPGQPGLRHRQPAICTWGASVTSKGDHGQWKFGSQFGQQFCARSYAGPANPFTGGLYVNGNAVGHFTADAQLGAAGQPITLNGGTLRERLRGFIDDDHPTDHLGPAVGLWLGPTVRHLAGLDRRHWRTDDASNSYAAVTLSGANTYTDPPRLMASVTLAGSNSGGGPTIISQGITYFSSASNFSSWPDHSRRRQDRIAVGRSIRPRLDDGGEFELFRRLGSDSDLHGQFVRSPGTFNVGGAGTLILSTSSPAIAGLAATGATLVVTGAIACDDRINRRFGRL